MAILGRTLIRFAGALMLGASATSIDNPGLLFAPTTAKSSAADGPNAAEVVATGPEVRIAPGKRAYDIRIDDVATLAGMVRPNSRVDIMVVINDPEQRKQVAKLFMENMRVLAIGAAPERTQDGRPISAAVASIEVTPTEAERLAIAGSQGSFHLLLRGNEGAVGVVPSTCEPRPSERAIVRDLLLRHCAAPIESRKDSSVAP